MSEKLARALYAESQSFMQNLASIGWRDPSGALSDSKSPVDLFQPSDERAGDLEGNQERPLVVGLFGGTGVGKSSLLNRLAGEDIARTGVVRPTSMEITAYLHKNVVLEALPDHFDATSFSATRHSNEALSDVMWVDMPDFDSDETANKEQVLQWLPHIDLLIYVVTPERYKDAEGWRMMLENSYRHAWLFVINQWDKASPVQYEDFTGLLERAGFVSPQVFRTVCVGQHPEDQFAAMVEVIASLANRNVVRHLQERGWMQRLTRASAQLKDQLNVLEVGNNRLPADSFQTRWQEFEDSAAAHLDAPFKKHSELFTENKTNAVGGVLKSLSQGRFNERESNQDIATNIAARSSTSSLWDEWLTVRYRDSIQQFRLADAEHGVPKEVFSALNFIGADKNVAANSPASTQVGMDAGIQETITTHLDQAVNDAIKAPGTKAQRFIAMTAAVLKIVLPVLALLWVVWRVVNGFVAGAEDRSAYVGVDFLVNGLLLAGLGWVLPMVVEKIFVPSLPDSIYRALHGGLKNGLDEMHQKVQPALTKISEEQNNYRSECMDLQQRIDKLLADASKTPDPMLSKLLMSGS